MTVYVELLFLDNLLMNALCLLLSARILMIRPLLWRTFIAGAVGGLYAVVFFVLRGSGITGALLMKLGFAAAMAGIALWPRSLKAFFKALGAFLMATLLLGGASFGLFYLLGESAMAMSGLIVYCGFPLRIMLLAAVLGTLAVERFTRGVRSAAAIKEQELDATVVLGGRRAKLRVMVDTGNSLTEPVSGFPVLLCDGKRVVPELFSEGVSGRFRRIPYRTIGSPLSTVWAFRPDSLELELTGGVVRVECAYVAFVDANVFCDGIDAIVGPLLLMGVVE